MTNRKRVEKRTTKKKKFSWKILGLFLVFEIIFTAMTAPFVLLYGPFMNAKKTYVGAAMTSFSHQYLATTFLSKDKINQILEEDVDTSDTSGLEQSNEINVNLPKKHDDTIERIDFENIKYKGYLLIVKDPTRVKVGYTSKLGKEGETTSQIAENFNAVAAINGGAFTDTSSTVQWTGNGGTPSGVIINQGKIIYSDINDDEERECMAITNEGRLLVGEYTISELKKLKVMEAVSFEPTLVKNGKKIPIAKDWGIAPRTAIGQREDGSILLMVIDGRSLLSGMGASMKEVQELMIKYGAVSAINLDGGKSSTMYLNDEVINNPSDSLGERAIPSAIIVK